MKTIKVDARQRVRLPDAKPEQVFEYENRGDGRFVLTLIKPEAEEPFPPGSLTKFISSTRDKEQLALLKGCSLEVPDEGSI